MPPAHCDLILQLIFFCKAYVAAFTSMVEILRKIAAQGFAFGERFLGAFAAAKRAISATGTNRLLSYAYRCTWPTAAYKAHRRRKMAAATTAQRYKPADAASYIV